MVAAVSSSSKAFSAGRLSRGTSQLLQECVDDAHLEGELKQLSFVLEVDRAHVVMLAKQRLITQAQATALLEEIEYLSREGYTRIVPEPGFGTINLQIENYLAQRIGQDTAGRLPIGRSRIDHGATVRRVSDRRSVLKVQKGLMTILDVLLSVASKHYETVYISFTHMQQAQPATFGHYLFAFFERLNSMAQQLAQIYDRFDSNPLGSVGLSGTELLIDRDLTASLLGFPSNIENSLAGRDAYYQIEIACALGQIMTVLNDLCSDLHIHSSTEFGYIEICDSHCSTSSIFPQKKNPVALEAVKYKAAEAHGWVTTALSIFRNEGTADQYYRSLPFLSSACATTADMLCLTAEVVERLSVNQARCEESLRKAWVTTNRLGNVLVVKHGLDFRTAHGIVGRMVRLGTARDLAPKDVTLELLLEAAEQMNLAGSRISLSQAELTHALDYKSFLLESNTMGSREFAQITAQAGKQKEECARWLDAREGRLASAALQLDRMSKQIRES